MSSSDSSSSESSPSSSDTEIKQTDKPTPTSTTSKPATYQYKKIGDLLDELDELLTRKREAIMAKASEKVNKLLSQLTELYQEIKKMFEKTETEPSSVDPHAIKDKQNKLSHLENQAVEGIYGVEAQICRLYHTAKPHHIRIDAIPPGQATIRDLIEQCHQMISRVLERIEEQLDKAKPTKEAQEQEQGQGQGQAGTEASMATTAQTEQGHIETTTQKESDQPKKKEKEKEKEEEKEPEKDNDDEKAPHVDRFARTAEGTSAPITSQGPGAGISAH